MWTYRMGGDARTASSSPLWRQGAFRLNGFLISLEKRPSSRWRACEPTVHDDVGESVSCSASRPRPAEGKSMVRAHSLLNRSRRRSRRPTLPLSGRRERRRERITISSGLSFLSPLANLLLYVMLKAYTCMAIKHLQAQALVGFQIRRVPYLQSFWQSSQG